MIQFFVLLMVAVFCFLRLIIVGGVLATVTSSAHLLREYFMSYIYFFSFKHSSKSLSKDPVLFISTL